jgi:hypothetical protein
MLKINYINKILILILIRENRMKNIGLALSSILLASCSYMAMDDSRDYNGYYKSTSSVDQLEYNENAALKNEPTEVNGHAAEAPKNYTAPKNGVPLEAPAVN